ncbi:pH nine-sensitive protein 1 [Candidozyma auris]|uniref:Protein PNS1 n=2 Tax=Candidozyma auris TaxID=498019 RepID=A0A2H0ZK62_CANAR|nr:hypothetical_protein [[Candida] auris]KND96393.2 protein pns1 [[Candida] auris]PIS51018.1 hypothetical protein B9J08_002588 [[Candida] auris]QEO19656.1 hypothetical_protein [[Candida] auris]QWW22519.1 hypothetical protein CA7LBN_001265 [[Candida] auris]GBL50361.1 hypothetical protein CAJCM15448_26350 [[Candida] auris]
MSYNPPPGPPPQQDGGPFANPGGYGGYNQQYDQNQQYQHYGGYNQGQGGYQQDQEAQSNGPFSEKPNNSENFDDAFKVQKPKFNDWPFALFFLATVCGFIAVAVITVRALKDTWSFQGGSIYDNNNTFTLNTNTVIMFAFSIVIAVVLSVLMIVIARLQARWFIILGLIMNVVLGIGTAIFYFVERYWSAAIVFLLFSLISAWCYWSARHRIPFSATVLEISIDVMTRYKSSLVVAFFGTVISGAFSALFSVVIVATYVKFNPTEGNPGCDVSGGNCSNAKVIGVLVFVFFAGYYISEVIKNVIHVTIVGIYGTWYYLASSDQGEPKWPALGALKRALTYCFGSICFGSLTVALLQLLRAFIEILKSNAFASGDNCAGCGYLILDFFIGFIEWAFRYFNHYAYVYVGLYGKSFLKSARETVDLLRNKGMDALINDCFINTSLNFWAMFTGYVAALFTFLYLKFTSPAYNSDGAYYAPMVAFTFLVSGQITRVSLVVLESGVSTFFVALAKDPEVFQMTNRNRFDEIFRNYPQVLEKLTANH